MKPVFVPFALHNLFVGPDDQGVTVFKGGLEVIFQPIKGFCFSRPGFPVAQH